MTAAASRRWPRDLDAGLRRLKLAAMRRLAPELMVTAKTQRWSPEEFLRTLLDAEMTSRDESNARARMKAAAFPVIKTIAEFDVAASSMPQATFDYLASLEWIRAAENYCAVGPAGTGKSHSLVAFGVAAVAAGHKVRYFTAAELVETLYRGLADNSVGRVIETILRADLVIIDEVGFAPLDDTGAQLLFRFIAAAYERRALGIGSTGPSTSGDGSCPSTPPPSACSTGSCTTPSSWSPKENRSACARPGPGQEDAQPEPEIQRGMETFTWPPAATRTWPLTRGNRIVGVDTELVEKLGRNDLCPCGSGRRFPPLLPENRPFRRSAGRLLRSGLIRTDAARFARGGSAAALANALCRRPGVVGTPRFRGNGAVMPRGEWLASRRGP